MILPDEDFVDASASTGAVSCISSEAYHADYESGDSHSSLESFRESPANYAAIRVLRTQKPNPPTSAMKVGSALHALLLEYGKECKFEMQQAFDRGIKNDLWYSSQKVASDKTLLSKKEMKLVYNMWLAILAEPEAMNLLVHQEGFNEQIVSAVDPLSGLLLKTKIDRRLKVRLVVDLKTVDGPVDPESWSRTLFRWGYHRQAAFYLDVLELAGQKADIFVFVPVSKDPPHELGIYPVDNESIELGRRENRDLLERLAECRKTGVWKHEWQGKIITVGVPRWNLKG